MAINRFENIFTTLSNQERDATDNAYNVRTEIQNASIPVVPEKSSVTATTKQAPTVSSTQVLAADSNRLGASFINQSDQICYINIGSNASATTFTVTLPSYDATGKNPVYELPYGTTDEVNVVFAATGTGNLIITEFS